MNARRSLLNHFYKRKKTHYARRQSTHDSLYNIKTLRESAALINHDPDHMKDFLRGLNAESLSQLREDVAQSEEFQDTSHPTQNQLFLTACHAGIPFIGFGFLDNFLMILWGEAIEYQFGIYGFSIMAAAAVGNTISDCGGVFCAEYIEHVARRFNIARAGLSPFQKRLTIVRIYNSLGAVLGVILGCILGMFPLYFIDNENFNIARKAFAYTERNLNGGISAKEAQSFFESISLTVSEQQVANFIQQHDKNKDGMLDEAEFIELFQKAMHPL